VIALTLDEVAELCSGRLDRAPWADEVTGVQIDSRRIEEGELFVAVGTGSDFVRHAFARGAAATLVPDDEFAALGALGAEIRRRSSAGVVAITGSTGKTSTKDILAAMCRPHAKTVAAEAGHNNEIGLPLTLTRIEPETELRPRHPDDFIHDVSEPFEKRLETLSLRLFFGREDFPIDFLERRSMTAGRINHSHAFLDRDQRSRLQLAGHGF
jgi:hypothetical protein